MRLRGISEDSPRYRPEGSRVGIWHEGLRPGSAVKLYMPIWE